MSKNYQFIAITGIDGSGKSTVIEKLRSSNISFAVADWEQVLRKGNLLEGLGIAFKKHPSSILRELKGLSRTLVLSAFLSLLVDYIIRPALSSGQRIIAESYVDIYRAKESVYGEAHPYIFELLDAMPQPEITIFIDTDPRIAYRRKSIKGTITKYECYHDGTMEDFVQFQLDVRERLLKLLESKKYIIVDGNQPPDVVASLIREHIIGEPNA